MGNASIDDIESFRNGSIIQHEGLQVAIQGHFEIMMSQVLPENYPYGESKLLFVIKVQIGCLNDLEKAVELKKVNIYINARNEDEQTIYDSSSSVDINEKIESTKDYWEEDIC